MYFGDVIESGNDSPLVVTQGYSIKEYILRAASCPVRTGS